MAYVEPTTRSTGFLVTAAVWNQDVVDNVKYLKGAADARQLIVSVLPSSDPVVVGDGCRRITIPAILNGWVLLDAQACVYTAATSDAPTFMVHNQTDAQDMLSTPITIDPGELSSYTSSTSPVINESYDDVATGDIIRFDVDAAGDGTLGLEFHLKFTPTT